MFNRLTGLRQHVGNFPGITVDVKKAIVEIEGESFQVFDFPGAYSVYPKSNEERQVFETLKDSSSSGYPDIGVILLDITNLEQNLLLLDQLNDLGIPLVVAINMTDLAKRKGLSWSLEALRKTYPSCVFVEINSRVGLGLDRLKKAVKEARQIQDDASKKPVFFESNEERQEDLLRRNDKLKTLAKQVITATNRDESISPLDKLFLHPVLGYFIFAVVLLAIFQTVFTLAAYPMDWIDMGMANLAELVSNGLPKGILTDLLADGIIAGLGGILVFIPQIALLFFLLALLEESGYLSRVVFLMDRLVRPFGLNGRSVVPLMSSWACAIPGVMAARTISNWKERMTTIFVAPLMSCSARLPVYTLLIALVIPDKEVFGFLNLQGLTLFALYALGLVSALLLAFIVKLSLKNRERSTLILAMPDYRAPHWTNVWSMVYNKTKSFVVDAGKIILAFSIILWAASTYGPDGNVGELELKNEEGIELSGSALQSAQVEESFLGIVGQQIEPVIRPLGYDWKIGIALLSSFAAREVFVSSLATIYAVESDEDPEPIIESMRSQTHRNGLPVFTLAAGLSLLVFYVYALQCMATVAVVKKETKSWSWPIIQLVVMGVWAYLAAWLVYVILS